MQAFVVEADGATIAGEARGERPALVLVHGMAGDRHDWDGLCAHLPAERPLLRYDLRGFGQSSAREGVAFSHSDDLLSLMDARGIARAALAGLSAGGATALNFALDHPDRVERLILVSPAIVAWEWSEEWRALWNAITAAARSGDMERARRLWWEHPLLASARASDAAAELCRSIDAYSGRQWVRDDQRDELPDVDRLHMLAVPTLLLTGELDVPDLRLIADILEAAVPDLRRIDMPGAGHMLTLEKPEAAARAIEAFLAQAEPI